MSPPGKVLSRTLQSPAAIHANAREGVYRLTVYFCCSLLALMVNYYSGKEMASDVLNYHLYAGFSALHNRFGQDYFAAGFRAYFNPYIYVPFYLLVTSGLSALQVASMLAVVHSVLLWITYELAIRVCPTDDERTRVVFAVLATALAFANPILLQQIGTSFADITTAELVLGGWLLLARAVAGPRYSLVLLAGVLAGLATGLKLTNAVHALAGLALLIMLPLGVRGRIRYALGYGLALGAGALAVMVPWGYRLYREFGNPLFPLMNHVFRSPYFTTERMFDYRFLPSGLLDALWRPFAMVKPLTLIHEELSSPDLRYAVLMVLLVILLLRWLWSAWDNGRSSAAMALLTPATLRVPARVLAALGLGLAADWLAWIAESGNSRYFLPMACIAAIVVIALLFQLWGARPKMRNYLLAAMFAVQCLQLYMGTTFRWNPAPWGGPWFSVNVPQKLATEPNLYLTMGAQSNSYIAPFLARGSGLINFTGTYALGPEGPNGERIRALMQRFAAHVRMLQSGKEMYADVRRSPNMRSTNTIVERFGLRVDPNDCESIQALGFTDGMLEAIIGKPSAADEGLPDRAYLVSCRLVADSSDHAADLAERSRADMVLNRVEDACPKLFQPRRTGTENFGNAWVRNYINTDLIAWVSRGWVKFRNPVRGGDLVFLGRESDWLRAPLPLSCGPKSGGGWFAKVKVSTLGVDAASRSVVPKIALKGGLR